MPVTSVQLHAHGVQHDTGIHFTGCVSRCGHCLQTSEIRRDQRAFLLQCDVKVAEVIVRYGQHHKPNLRFRPQHLAGERGYDAAKKTKGIKRHILVDTLGLLLAVCVTGADVPERAGARNFLGRALVCFRWLRCLWADQGYGGNDFAGWVATHRKTGTLRLEVVPRNKTQRGFAALPKRWIVERTFGWFMKHRRLVRHYEIKTSHVEAWLHISMIGIMLRRLA